MKNFNNYFREAEESANQSFMNADGYNYAEGYDYSYAEGQNNSAPSGQTSQPFIISLANSTSANITTSTSLFGAFQAIGAVNNALNAGLIVASGMPNVTYQQLLYQSMNKPFAVGYMYIQGSNYGTNAGSPAAQILEVLTITQRDASGNQNTQPLKPIVDPYQQQTTITVLKFAYIIDAQTTVTPNQIWAFTTAIFSFYPAGDVNIARGLVGRSVNQDFGNPNLIKNQNVQISPNTVKAALNM